MTANRAPVATTKRADRRRLQRPHPRTGRARPELMRQPGGLAEVPEPVPLYRTGRDTTTERTTS